MPAIKLNQFNGIMPRVADKLLPENCAVTAQNVRLTAGRLDPITGPGSVSTITTGQKTIYLWRYNDTSAWLTWATLVDVVQSPIADDTWARIFYTGDGAMKVKGYVTGTGVVTRGVKKTAPTAPTPTVAALFSPATVTCKQFFFINDALYDTQTLDYIGHEETATGYKIRFAVEPADVTGPATYTYFIERRYQFVVGGTTFPAGSGTPNVLSTSDAKPPETTVALSTAGKRYATFQVVDITAPANWVDTYYSRNLFGYDIVVDSGELVVHVNMHWERGSTAYCYYMQTLVDDWGQESPPSALTAQVEVRPGRSVTLGTLGTAPAGENTAYRRFYRSAAGTSEDKFLFLAEIAVATSSYIDVLPDSELAEEMPLFENPPDDLEGLVMMPGGFAAAYRDRELCFSPPFLPYSWPTAYRLAVDYDIMGLAVSGNDLVILTKGNPYIASGSHPESMTLTKLMLNQSCVSTPSICQVGNVICYASPDGMCMIQGGQANLATEKHFDRADWQALTPTSMVCEVHDKQLFAFAGSAGMIFDFDEGLAAASKTTETATAIFNDLESDTLYFVQGTGLKSWEGGATPLTMTWKSKAFAFARRIGWTSARVVAASYPVAPATLIALKLYANGTLVTTVSVTSESSFRLPYMTPAKVWHAEVVSTVAIDEVRIATSMQELG